MYTTRPYEVTAVVPVVVILVLEGVILLVPVSVEVEVTGTILTVAMDPVACRTTRVSIIVAECSDPRIGFQNGAQARCRIEVLLNSVKLRVSGCAALMHVWRLYM